MCSWFCSFVVWFFGFGLLEFEGKAFLQAAGLQLSNAKMRFQ
jgi:hypothetical protein